MAGERYQPRKVVRTERRFAVRKAEWEHPDPIAWILRRGASRRILEVDFAPLARSTGGHELDIRNVGGTPGGTKTFLLGIVMIIIGGYLLFNQVSVHGGGFWARWGFGGYTTSFGIVLIPLLIGVAIMFANGKSLVGRVLVGGGFLIIVVGIIANLDIHFRQTSLLNTLIMLICLVGGIGLVVRSVLPMQAPAKRDDTPQE